MTTPRLIPITLIMLFTSMVLSAQPLAGTSWSAYWGAPFNDSICIEYTADTIYIAGSAGNELLTDVYVESNDTIWESSVSGPFACPVSDTGIFTYVITGNTITWTLVSDSCTGRALTIDGSSWTMKTEPTGIQPQSTNNAFYIFPLPSADEVTVKWEDRQNEVGIVITNMLGQVVYDEIIHNQSDARVSVRNWRKGLYQVKLLSQDDVKIASLLVN